MTDSQGSEHLFGLVTIALNADNILSGAGIGSRELVIELAVRGKDGLGAAGGLFYGNEKLFDSDAVVTDVVFPHGSWRPSPKADGVRAAAWPRDPAS